MDKDSNLVKQNLETISKSSELQEQATSRESSLIQDETEPVENQPAGNQPEQYQELYVDCSFSASGSDTVDMDKDPNLVNEKLETISKSGGVREQETSSGSSLMQDETEPAENEPAGNQPEEYQEFSCSLSECSTIEYIPTATIKNIIIRTRHEFEVLSEAKKAPLFIPTIFYNHGDRVAYLKERERRCRTKSPKKRVDAYNLFISVLHDIQENFKKSLFLKHSSKVCELVTLKKEFSPELVFEELFMLRPSLYSKNIDEKKKCKYVDPDHINWKFRDCHNKDETNLLPHVIVVEFCVIYPEDKTSTVIVHCAVCGLSTETVLSEFTLRMLKKKLPEYFMSLEISADKPHGFRGVIPLPSESIEKPLDASHADGLMGLRTVFVTPSKPSVFIRLRLRYAFDSYCNIKRSIHNNNEEVLECYPDYVQKYLL